MNGAMHQAMNQQNRHCSVVRVADTGVLIEGASGSGKTSLALGLIDIARLRGLNAALICDDQALLAVCDGELVASAPAATSGLAEIRGYGLAEFSFEPSCAIGLIGRLVSDNEIKRMPEAETAKLMGVTLPMVRLPERHEQQSVRILLARIGKSSTGPAEAKKHEA